MMPKQEDNRYEGLIVSLVSKIFSDVFNYVFNGKI